MKRKLTPLPWCRAMTSLLAISLTIVICGPLPVSAAGQKSKTAATAANDEFARADANHDNKLSREEAGDYLVYLVFTARDKNQDNRLTLQEWTRGDQSKVAAFRQRDTNRDGVVTLDEAIIYGRQGGAALSLMRAADKNRDNKLDRTEINAYLSGHQNPAG